MRERARVHPESIGVSMHYPHLGGDAPTAFSPEVIYGTPVADRFDLAANRGNIAAVRRQRVLVSAIYELPVGHGRHFFSHMGSIPQAVLGGWSVSTVSLWQTGPYLTPITSPSYDPGNLNLVYIGERFSGRTAWATGTFRIPTPVNISM
jgi:hypothetical protein